MQLTRPARSLQTGVAASAGLRSSGLVLLVAAAAGLAGCTAGPTPRLAKANAPLADGGGPARGMTNPNGPFTLVSRSPRLATRPAAIDVEAAPSCNAQDLSVFESGSQVNGDRRAVRLTLVNHGSSPCRLGGYPSISLLHKDGTLVGSITIDKMSGGTLTANLTAAPAGESEVGPSPQVLLGASGGEASFNIGWQTGEQCDEVAQIAIAAPGTTSSFSINHPINVCAGRIQVTAMNSGTPL